MNKLLVLEVLVKLDCLLLDLFLLEVDQALVLFQEVLEVLAAVGPSVVRIATPCFVLGAHLLLCGFIVAYKCAMVDSQRGQKQGD